MGSPRKETSEGRFELYDAQGRLALAQALPLGQTFTQVLVCHLPAGLYYYTILNGTSVVYRGKSVIQHYFFSHHLPKRTAASGQPFYIMKSKLLLILFVFNLLIANCFCQNFDQVWVVGLGDGKKWDDKDISAVMFMDFSTNGWPKISFSHDINFNFITT